MAKAKNHSDEPYRLIVSRNKARQSIGLQIEKGCPIRDDNINSEADLEKAKESYSKWSSYNLELLKSIFSNDAIVKEYSMVGFGVVVMGYGTAPIQKKIKDFKVRVGKKISTLESINERLELIPETGIAESDIRYEDVLLPILNRRYVNEIFPSIIKDNIFHKQPISLIMIDIDNFGSFNKTYSITVGDDVLKLTGNLIKEVVGEKGKVARYGGEEISIILPNYNIEEAVSLAERIRKTIEQYSFNIKGKVVKITVSAGVSSCLSSIELKDFIERADTAVQISKSKGRNQVSVFEQGIPKTTGIGSIMNKFKPD